MRLAQPDSNPYFLFVVLWTSLSLLLLSRLIFSAGPPFHLSIFVFKQTEADKALGQALVQVVQLTFVRTEALLSSHVRQHGREGDEDVGAGASGREGEESVLHVLHVLLHHTLLLLLRHQLLEGDRLCPHPCWSQLPSWRQGRVHECRKTHVLLLECVTEI